MKKIWLIGLAILTVGLWSNLSFAEIAADEYYRQGCNCYEEKNYSEAAKSFEKAIKLESDNSIYHYNLGITYCVLKKYKEAVPYLKKAVEIDPDGQAGKLSAETLNELKKIIPIKTEANSTTKFRSDKEESEAQKLKNLVFETIEFPDGLVERQYSFVLVSEDATPPYKLTLLFGTLPSGLTINQRIGGIEGTPEQVGERELMLSLVDAKGEKKNFKGTIRIWRLLTVGANGTFKGFDGIQMAINMAQNLDEIRIQSGIYKGTGLVIPKNKIWDYGIKISGGWDEEFLNRRGKTILDGEKKEDTILTISNEKGKLFFESLIVENSGKFAIYSDNKNDPVSFTDCTFTQNSTKQWGGGAVYVEVGGPEALFTNCIFTNNLASYGGAIEVRNKKSTFINCVFKNNRATGSGGAVSIEYSKVTFTNCIFDNNMAEGYGGAVKGEGIFTNCNFTNNMAEGGGALHGGGTFVNCTFYNNSATGIHESWGSSAHGGAIYLKDDSIFINCAFSNNFSKACGGSFFAGKWGWGNLTLINCLFFKNSASYGGVICNSDERKRRDIRITNCTFSYSMAEKGGGAILCEGGGNVEIINSIFCKNMVGENCNDIKSKGKLNIDYCLINHLEGAANFGSHNITGDPKFVDPENENFSLRADSPCINKGIVNEEIKKVMDKFKESFLDLGGNPRITGEKIDLGAYEGKMEKPLVFQKTTDKSKEVLFEFKTVEFPDGLVGKNYSFSLVPRNKVLPIKINISSGSLPSGILINEKEWKIQGKPKQTGKWEFTFSIIDKQGEENYFEGTIRIWNLLTVGANGTFKGFDGIQMAINMAQNLDEIRIQSGIYKGTGLVIPKNKIWDYGIKISGGWDEEFLNRRGKTILDGEKKGNRILTILNKQGELFIENLTFRNSKKGGVGVEASTLFTDCIFHDNSETGSGTASGGAVNVSRGKATFVRCIFENNLASFRGGAVHVESTWGQGFFINCVFRNNSAVEGGAAYEGKVFNNCIFKNNSAHFGGAGCRGKIFVNCFFTKNSSRSGGGAIYDGKYLINCIFTDNSADGNGGAVSTYWSDGTCYGCVFDSNFCKGEGGAVSKYYRIINCTFYGNKSGEGSGAVLSSSSLFSSETEIINSIFCNNSNEKGNNDIELKKGVLNIDYCLINHLEEAANFGSHNITGDPKFVDPKNRNFLLKSDSPCIDKGTNKVLEEIKKEIEKKIEDEEIKKLVEESISLDLAGNSRIVGGNVDLGTYEWQGK